MHMITRKYHACDHFKEKTTTITTDTYMRYQSQKCFFAASKQWQRDCLNSSRKDPIKEHYLSLSLSTKYFESWKWSGSFPHEVQPAPSSLAKSSMHFAGLGPGIWSFNNSDIDQVSNEVLKRKRRFFPWIYHEKSLRHKMCCFKLVA